MVLSVLTSVHHAFFNWLHRHDGGTRKVANAPGPSSKRFENKYFFPVVIDAINQGHTATINLRGRSMRPFLEDERDRALLTKPTGLKVGDPVLAEIEPGHYVLHRIIKIKDGNVTLMGDGNLSCEYCTTDDFRASVIGFYRKGSDKLDRTDGMKWKIYSWFWMRLRPIRRYLLAAYRYIWLNIFRLDR